MVTGSAQLPDTGWGEGIVDTRRRCFVQRADRIIAFQPAAFDHGDLTSGLGQRDRQGHSSGAGTDDRDVGFDALTRLQFKSIYEHPLKVAVSAPLVCQRPTQEFGWVLVPGVAFLLPRNGQEASMATRDDIRNVAIVAHVDHGKTTLVDALLQQSGAMGRHVVDRVMDSHDLEREKGITILAKTTSVDWDGMRINIVDTPGHADFGGEVERGLPMVDGILLLVDAAEGPLPQTRFVLRKALERNLPMVVVINKMDRPDERHEEVLDEVYELLFALDAQDHHIEFPVLYAVARNGIASTDPEDPALTGDGEGSLVPLLEALRDTVPAPSFDPAHPLQAHVMNLDANPYQGRLAICRVQQGTLKAGQSIAWCRLDGTIQTAKVADLAAPRGLERVSVAEAGPGEIVAVAGLEDVMPGETLADLDDPRPLPVLRIDEPSLSVTIGVNTSPLAGQSGKKLTARLIKSRLDAETIGNVSLQVISSDRPDAWEVRGRGELQLAVLVEEMRREGFELTVSRPEVLEQVIDGVRHEPFERLVCDVPEDRVGAVTQLLGPRKGRLESMDPSGSGRVRLEYVVPARGLLGFRSDFLTETRGEGLYHHTFEGWMPWAGGLDSRRSGALVADRLGQATTFAILNLQARGSFFIAPADEVYEGMIIGEHPRPEDMDVNITKAKKVNNIRAAAAEELERITPPRKFSLEQALEYLRPDECLEVTPDQVRMRKQVLDGTIRAREAKRAKQDGPAGNG